jgi:hypothetical protein
MTHKKRFISVLPLLLCSSLLLSLAFAWKGEVLAQRQLDLQDGSHFLYLPLTMKNFQPAWIIGRVTVQGQGAALAGAQVCTQNGECAFSDAAGNYRLHVSAGWKQLIAQKQGYISVTQSLQVPALETRAVDFALQQEPNSPWWAKFSGIVKDLAGQALSNARVCTHLNECTTTASDGSYIIDLTSLGQREVTASKDGYLPLTKSATALINQTVTVDFNLSRQWQGAWIKGAVIDASKGINEQRALAGVRLCTQFNECTTTDPNGNYRIGLSSADLREVTAQLQGFFTVSKQIQPIEGEEVILNFVLSPYLTNQVARIIVTWDATPKFVVGLESIENDLDAYLYIEHAIGNRVIYYEAGGEFLSSLLLYDVREGSGPETIDIRQYELSSPQQTRYRYGVHHANYEYSGRQIPNLYQLGAQVCFYTREGNVSRCYQAPPGDLEFWVVFEFDPDGNYMLHNCLASGIPQISEDEGGNRVVGQSFPTCASP